MGSIAVVSDGLEVKECTGIGQPEGRVSDDPVCATGGSSVSLADSELQLRCVEPEAIAPNLVFWKPQDASLGGPNRQPSGMRTWTEPDKHTNNCSSRKIREPRFHNVCRNPMPPPAISASSRWIILFAIKRRERFRKSARATVSAARATLPVPRGCRRRFAARTCHLFSVR